MLNALHHLVTAESASAVEYATRLAFASESGRPDRFKTFVSLLGVRDLLPSVCRPIVAPTTRRVQLLPSWSLSLLLIV